MHTHVLYWLDNIRIYHSHAEGMLNAILLLSELFSKKNIKFRSSKCWFFANEILWCDKVLSSEGICFDPRRIDGIPQM